MSSRTRGARLSRRVLSKVKRWAVATAQPPAVKVTSWYLPRLAQRPNLRNRSLEQLVVTSFQGLYPGEFNAMPDAQTRRVIVDQFHRLYYNDTGTWRDTSWLGVTTWKCPLDLWIYQEILQELRPQLIIECGTAHGGSAFFLASVCDLLGHGQIVTIDVELTPGRPVHPRITYLHGSSVDPQVVEQIRAMIRNGGHVLVILDSDHRESHVSRELDAYSPMVTVGSYLVVEDTNVNNHPVYPSYGPGPMEAVEQFLRENDQFVVDEGRQKHHLTFNPRGYLRRVN